MFVWSDLSKGDPAFTLSQGALNDAITVVAFAPVAGLPPGLSAITAPRDMARRCRWRSASSSR